MMKILLVRLSSAGDVLLCSSTIRALKNSVKNVEVSLLTKGCYREAAAAAGADRVFCAGSGSSSGLMGKLNRMSFDSVVDLQGSLKSALIVRNIRAKRKSTVKKDSVKRRLMTAFKWFPREFKTVDEKYLEAAGKAVPGTVLCLPEPVKKKKKKASLIVMHVGAKWPLKRWPYMEELAEEISRKKGVKVILTGLKSEVEKRKKTVYSKNVKIKDMVGRTGFGQFLKLVKKADLFIGNDTAAAHAAKMYGVPAIVFMGPTVSQFGFITKRDFEVAEKDLLCRPCHVHGGKKCPVGTFECLSSIKAGDAVKIIKKYL